MQDNTPNTTLGFQVLPEEQRELSCNHSYISNSINPLLSYEQLQSQFKNLTSPNINLQALHQSPKLKLKKYKQAVYYGEYLGGKRQGKGIMFYHNGQRYDGDWKSDQRHGQGFQVFANGSVYEGDYVQNKMHGQGKYIWPGGETYQGEWQDNIKHGSGMWVNQKGDSYVGEWVEGTASGFGVYTEIEASRYEGTFSGFIKNGKGTQKFVTGDLYQGQYLDGKFHGFGEYYWNNGSSYKGEFKEGLKEGYGVWRKADSGQKYQGQFCQNRKQGYGIYTWANGNIYKGSYHSNIRHGIGEMYWNDGTFYKGSWLVDKPNGKGTLFDGQSLIKGIFKDGEMVDYDQPQEQPRKISQFYLENGHTKRVIATPIRKITQSPTQRHQMNRLNLSQVQKDARVRQIRPIQASKRYNPSQKDNSFFRRKLMQTIQFDQHSNKHQRINSTDNRSIGSKSQSRQKVMHSAFQVHKLYRNKRQSKPPPPPPPPIQPTTDSKYSFAFSTHTQIPRSRYGSRRE